MKTKNGLNYGFFSGILFFFLHLYRKTISPDHGILRFLFPIKGACVMFPTCSEYMELAIIKYGPIKGLFRGFRRILRCHPYQKKLIDEP